MGMPREPGDVILRTIVSEVVEQQERIELLGTAEPKGPTQPYACAFESRLRGGDAADRSDGP
jgi:hypothetical protein